MTMFLAPYTAIADIDGSPLDAGFLFFGEYGKDPELFPVEVFWDSDFTVPAAQPIRTRNGYPVRNGSPTKVYLKTAQHSIVIKNRNSAFILVDFKNKGWDSSFVVHKGQTQYDINEEFFNKKWEKVSVKDFGAKGDDDQTLYATDYYSDLDGTVRITQQTADGLAFNMAIKWLRNKGGGSLYIPPCESGKSYRIYGYLEIIDFPCVIYGAGANSLIKNCDNSPTNTNGYGIFCVQPQNYEEISFLNFKVDGNAEVRIKPTAEFRQYPLAIYGKPQLKMFGITSVNSPIDCFMTSYVDNDPETYVKTVNCHFDNSFRNTVSLVSGWNQYHVNMTVDRGGYVHGGTQPRYGIDIEPNLVGRSIENLHFTNCQFKRAINVCVGGVWAQAKFDNCTFDGSVAHSSKLTDKTYPWLFQLTEGKWQLNNCRFIGRDDYMQNASHHFNSYNANSKFNDSQYLKLHDCIWEKCGFISTSRSVEMIDCFAQNSLHPFIFSGGTTTNNNDVFIRDLTLKNVFDDGNYGTGTESSFAITNSLVGKIDVDGVTVEIDATSLKSIPKELFTKTRYYGVTINPTKSTTAGKRVFIRNVHSEGFYKRLAAYLERTENSGNMRDWNFPTLPPENTIKLTSAVTATLTDGTVANNQVTNKSVTGSATENSSSSTRTLGNKGAVYYNCTMWGDFN